MLNAGDVHMVFLPDYTTREAVLVAAVPGGWVVQAQGLGQLEVDLRQIKGLVRSGRAPRLTLKSAPPKAAKKKVTKRKPPRKLPRAQLAADPKDVSAKFESKKACLRSPCGVPDPKLSRSRIGRAMGELGTSKLKRRVVVKGDVVSYVPTRSYNLPGTPAWPLTVAYGLGIDSTAILVGLVQIYRETGDERWIPKAITFADVGGEKPETYAFLKRMNAYLRKSGFPKVTVVAWATEMRQRGPQAGWGTGVTLEVASLNTHTVPSISVSGKSNCSDKFKIQPQRKWLKDVSGLFPLRPGTKVIRAIGYDSTEGNRLVKGSTYNSTTESKEPWAYSWYPLIEWGWDRARCYAEIKNEIGVVPPKSSCFFCGAMKPEEVARLPKDLLKRALFMEQVALLGRWPLRQVPGLGRSWAWTDFALGETKSLAARQRVLIEGGIVDETGARAVVYVGAPQSDVDPSRDQVYYPPQKRPLLTKAEVNSIKALAKAWVKVTPKTKGQLDKDLWLHPLASKIPAYTKLLGFRGTSDMDWDRFEEILIEEGRGFRRNPPEVGHQGDPSPLAWDPLLDGDMRRTNPYPGDLYRATPLQDGRPGQVELLERNRDGWKVRGDAGEFDVQNYQLRGRLPPGGQSLPLVALPARGAPPQAQAYVEGWVDQYSPGIPQERLMAGYVLRNDDYFVMPGWRPGQQQLQEDWFGRGDPGALRWDAYQNRGGRRGRELLKAVKTPELVSWIKRKKIADFRRNPVTFDTFLEDVVPPRWRDWVNTLEPRRRSQVLARWWFWWTKNNKGTAALFGRCPWAGDPPSP